MAAPPVYEVEFIPLERRLNDRRGASPDGPLLPDSTADRRKPSGRRAEEKAPASPAKKPTTRKK
jgi:hypothetical protein